MRIPPFRLERFFDRHEFTAPFLLCCSDCQSWTVGDLLALEEGAGERFQELGLGYTESPGKPSLRAEIAKGYDRLEADQVLVHSCAEEAIFNLMNVLLERGDHLVVHWPCYQSLLEVARAVGARVSPWRTREEEGWELSLAELGRLLEPKTKAVVVNLPHNPTGYLMDRAKLEELFRLSAEQGFRIFSDEVYRGLEGDGGLRLPRACDLDPRAVSLGSMSKVYGLAGLRIGWLATRDQELYQDLAGFKDYTTICSSGPSEFLSELALRHADKLISRNKGIIEANLKLLDELFAGRGDLFSWLRPPAGPIAFPSLRQGLAEEFCQKLLDRTGVLLLPGTVYDQTLTANFRIGFGRENFPEGLERLGRFLEERH